MFLITPEELNFVNEHEDGVQERTDFSKHATIE